MMIKVDLFELYMLAREPKRNFFTFSFEVNTIPSKTSILNYGNRLEVVSNCYFTVRGSYL